MVGNSLDEWQNDSFFAAAEEVQESSDAMESAYRIWMKEKADSQNFDQLCNDLHTSLGTAKWQLEEFERAVKLSYGQRGCRNDDDDATSARHAHFIAAIESKIARIESSLRDALNEQGKQPLRWVHLDNQENDDLALFLSASGTSSVSFHSPAANQERLDRVCGNRHHGKHGLVNSSDDIDIVDDGKRQCKEAIITKDSDADHVIHIGNSPAMRDGLVGHLDTSSCGTRGHCTLSNFRALRILVSNEDEQFKNPLSTIEDTPKDKELKPFFGRLRGGIYFLANGSMFNKEGGDDMCVWKDLYWDCTGCCVAISPIILFVKSVGFGPNQCLEAAEKGSNAVEVCSLYPTYPCANAKFILNCSFFALFKLRTWYETKL